MTEEQLKELKALLDELKRLSQVTVDHVADLGMLDLTKLPIAKRKFDEVDNGVEKAIGQCVEAGTEHAFDVAKDILLEAITIKNEGLAHYTQLALERARQQMKGPLN
jgi:hypothetical protein